MIDKPRKISIVVVWNVGTCRSDVQLREKPNVDFKTITRFNPFDLTGCKT